MSSAYQLFQALFEALFLCRVELTPSSIWKYCKVLIRAVENKIHHLNIQLNFKAALTGALAGAYVLYAPRHRLKYTILDWV